MHVQADGVTRQAAASQMEAFYSECVLGMLTVRSFSVDCA